MEPFPSSRPQHDARKDQQHSIVEIEPRVGGNNKQRRRRECSRKGRSERTGSPQLKNGKSEESDTTEPDQREHRIGRFQPERVGHGGLHGDHLVDRSDVDECRVDISADVVQARQALEIGSSTHVVTEAPPTIDTERDRRDDQGSEAGNVATERPP
jgi:hypothetical protein